MRGHSLPRLAAFARLLCGDDVGSVMTTAAQCGAAVEAFRALSPTAPLPVPMAVAVAAQHVRSRAYREASAMIASHHRPQEVVSGLVAAIKGNEAAYDGESLKVMAELLRSSSAPGENDFLVLLAEYSLTHETTQPSLKAEARQRIQRRVRFHPSSAAALLRPLCRLSSPPTRANVEDVLEAMQIAMRGGGFVDPDSLGAVLEVVRQSGDYPRVLRLWVWMRQTSACWNREAASAALCAAAELHFLDDAVACVQCLAEAGQDPTTCAQQAFIRFLGLRTPPLPSYAEQLVDHWYNTGETAASASSLPSLWCGEGQAVAVELLLVHLRSHNRSRLRELLQRACGLWTGEDGGAAAAPLREEAVRFLKREGVPLLMRELTKEIGSSPAMQRIFVDIPNEMIANGDDFEGFPLLAGAFTVLCWRLGRLAQAKDALGQRQAEGGAGAMTDEAFRRFIEFVADEAQHGQSPQHVLATMQELAAVVNKPVPVEVSAWVQLLDEEQGQQHQSPL